MPRPAGETRYKVRDLTKKGLTPREISLRLGITTQAVYQHLHRLRTGKRAS